MTGQKQIKCLWDPKNAFHKSHLKENDSREEIGNRGCAGGCEHRKSRKNWIHCHSGMNGKKGTAGKNMKRILQQYLNEVA
jgi:hypothetical protein